MLGIFAIVCLVSYILISMRLNYLLNKGSDRNIEIGTEPCRYEVCGRGTPLILACQIILLIGYVGCFWPFFFIEGIGKGEYIAAITLAGIVPPMFVAFAIYLTFRERSGFIAISCERIEYHRGRKHFSLDACNIQKVSPLGSDNYVIHPKDKKSKKLQINIGRFNRRKEIASLLMQMRELLAIANGRQESFGHRFGERGFEVVFGKIYMSCCRYGVLLLLVYTSWCCIDYDFFRKDYVKEFNELGAIEGQSENAWDYYVKAAAEYSKLDEDLQEIINKKVEQDPNLAENQVVELKEWYLENTAALENLKKAASIDYCNSHYEILHDAETNNNDFSSPSDAGYGAIKNLYFNLDACRRLSIAQMDWVEVFEMQLCSARHFVNGKSLIDQLVGYAMLDNAIKQISSNEILNEDIENAGQLLSKYFPNGVEPISLEGEILIQCAIYESIINYIKIPRQTPLNQIFIMCGSISGTERHLRKRHEVLIDQAAKGIEAEETEPSFFSFPIMRGLFGLREPATLKVYKISERANSNVWAGYAAIDIEKYKLENGEYPETLADLALTSELPKDPHSDGKIVYRVDEKRAVLYSVGRNGVDDGGYRDEKANENRRDDVIYWEREF